MQISSRQRERRHILGATTGVGVLLLTGLMHTSVLAQASCNERAPALREAFDHALADTYLDVRVTRLVSVEDRREFGCHLIFDMSDGNQIQGMFSASQGDLRWTADEATPLEYERRVMSQKLVEPLVLPKAVQPPEPIAEAGKTWPMGQKPLANFNARDVCGALTQGRDSAGWFDEMRYQASRIRVDIDATLQALGETELRLKSTRLTPAQLKQNRAIEQAQQDHIDLQLDLSNQMQVQCPRYFQEHRFDGR